MAQLDALAFAVKDANFPAGVLGFKKGVTEGKTGCNLIGKIFAWAGD